MKAPPPPKRRDENKGNLILNDHKQTSVAKHQGFATIPPIYIMFVFLDAITK